MTMILPSVLAADPGCLREEALRMERLGADAIHLDIMDGCFVPNLSFGPSVAAMLSKALTVPLDVHLMVQGPERWIAPFIDAGARFISIHPEATPHAQRALAEIARRGAMPGAALNPGTPLSALDWILDDCAFVLIMTVNPGFGGQRLIPACVEKVRALRERIDKRALCVSIEVDGGVDVDTASVLIQAGANMLVAGSSLFGAADAQAALNAMKGGS